MARRARCTAPGQPHVHYNHGKFRDLELGETRAAENDYRRTLLLAPAHPRALINIHRPLSKREQWATSLLLARVAVRLMPGEPLGHQARAVELNLSLSIDPSRSSAGGLVHIGCV